MKRNGLIGKVRNQTRVLLNGYLGDLSDDYLSEWLVISQHGSDAGLVGALSLAQQAIVEKAEETTDSPNKLKQTAYKVGVRHGFYLGLSAAYVGFVLYARSGKSSSRR